MAEMIEAVRKKDFAAFAELTMKDSNQFHATCLDTYPPIFYLNSVSQRVISLVHRYNTHYGETRVSSVTLLFLRGLLVAALLRNSNNSDHKRKQIKNECDGLR